MFGTLAVCAPGTVPYLRSCCTRMSRHVADPTATATTPLQPGTPDNKPRRTPSNVHGPFRSEAEAPVGTARTAGAGAGRKRLKRKIIVSDSEEDEPDTPTLAARSAASSTPLPAAPQHNDGARRLSSRKKSAASSGHRALMKLKQRRAGETVVGSSSDESALDDDDGGSSSSSRGSVFDVREESEEESGEESGEEDLPKMRRYTREQCTFCGNRKVAMGQKSGTAKGRANGRPVQDWGSRSLHAKCYKKVNAGSGYKSEYFWLAKFGKYAGCRLIDILARHREDGEKLLRGLKGSPYPHVQNIGNAIKEDDIAESYDIAGRLAGEEQHAL